MSEEKVAEIIKLMTELSTKELERVREATYAHQEKVEVICPHCKQLAVFTGQVDIFQPPDEGTIPLVVDDDGHVFYDWDHGDITLGVDCVCTNCGEYVSCYDVEKIWKAAHAKAE